MIRLTEFMKLLRDNKRIWFWAVLGAIVAGILYVGPQIVIRKAVEASGRSYVLPQFTRLDDGGDGYLQFAREIYDGHFPPKDLFLDQSLPNIYPPLPPLILSAFIFVTQGDVVTGYLVALFVIPALIFLLFFWLGWMLFERKLTWAVFIGFLGILTPIPLITSQIFFSLDNFVNIFLKNFYPGINTLLPLLFWSRIDYPLLTSLVYLPAIALTVIFLEKPRPLIALTASAVSGLLFYTYFHIWSYWLVVGVIFAGGALVLLRKERTLLRNLFLMVFVVFLISLPYFFNQFTLSRLPSYGEYINRLGIERGSFFRWEAWPHYLLYFLLAGAVYFFLWRDSKKRKRAVFWWACLAAALVVWNAQLVLGFVPHSDHWPRSIDVILFLIILDVGSSFLHTLINRRAWLTKIAPLMVICLSLLLVVKKSNNIAKFVKPPESILTNHSFPEEQLDAWRWMNSNLREPGILSSSFVSGIYAMAFSSARPYMATGGLSPISNFEIEERFLVANKLFGVSENILEARLRDGEGLLCDFDCDRKYVDVNLRDARFLMHQLFYRDSVPSNKIPESKIGELLKRYRDLETDWKSVGAEFVYYGPFERQFSEIDFREEEDLELIYQNPTIEIYKILK